MGVTVGRAASVAFTAAATLAARSGVGVEVGAGVQVGVGSAAAIAAATVAGMSEVGAGAAAGEAHEAQANVTPTAIPRNSNFLRFLIRPPALRDPGLSTIGERQTAPAYQRAPAISGVRPRRIRADV